MGKYNCCVPKCSNNWRNSPGLKFHSLPADHKVRVEYKRLIRNDNLKEFSTTTKICGAHFPGGERMSQAQLPTLFPWTKPEKTRREIMKYDLPKRAKTSEQRSSPSSTVCCADNVPEATVSELGCVSETESQLAKTNSGSLSACSENPALDSDVVEPRSMTTDGNDKSSLYNEQEAEIVSLKERLNSLEKDFDKLKYKHEHEPKFDIDVYKNCDEDISFFTGFTNYGSMVLCYDILKVKAANLSYGGHQRLNFDVRKSATKRKLSLWQEFTLVLLRLRLGLLERDLAERYRVSVSTISDICRTWIKFMKCELQPLCIVWPSKEQLKFYMPPVFRELYPELVSIIDCTEIRMESPSSLDKQSVCYSSYKSHTTMKALLGITPNGAVSFASELYCGSISDPDIVEKPGFISYLHKGDLVMADKGFIIRDQLADVGARLVMPNFLSDKGQFTQTETQHNKKIASLRIHVERYMERLKNWHLFDRVIPITTASISSDAWIVIACLSNFWLPMIT